MNQKSWWRQIIKSTLLFIIPFMLFSACKKQLESNLTTDLNLTILFKTNDYYNEDSVKAPSAKVLLFKSKVDMEARLRPVASGEADQNGKVVLKNLEPFPYFVYAYYDNGKDYYDNSANNNQLKDILVEGSITFVNIPLYLTRPSFPSKMECEYVEILKYDTTAGGCSRDFYVKIAEQDRNTYINYPLDSTYTAYYCFGDYYSRIKYVSFNKNSIDLDTSYFGFQQYFVITLNDTLQNGGTNFAPSESYYFYPSEYFRDNSYGNMPYPTRLRLWEANTIYDQKKTIDLIISWH